MSILTDMLLIAEGSFNDLNKLNLYSSIIKDLDKNDFELLRQELSEDKFKNILYIAVLLGNYKYDYYFNIDDIKKYNIDVSSCKFSSYFYRIGSSINVLKKYCQDKEFIKLLFEKDEISLITTYVTSSLSLDDLLYVTENYEFNSTNSRVLKEILKINKDFLFKFNNRNNIFDNFCFILGKDIIFSSNLTYEENIILLDYYLKNNDYDSFMELFNFESRSITSYREIFIKFINQISDKEKISMYKLHEKQLKKFLKSKTIQLEILKANQKNARFIRKLHEKSFLYMIDNNFPYDIMKDNLRFFYNNDSIDKYSKETISIIIDRYKDFSHDVIYNFLAYKFTKELNYDIKLLNEIYPNHTLRFLEKVFLHKNKFDEIIIEYNELLSYDNICYILDNFDFNKYLVGTKQIVNKPKIFEQLCNHIIQFCKDNKCVLNFTEGDLFIDSSIDFNKLEDYDNYLYTMSLVYKLYTIKYSTVTIASLFNLNIEELKNNRYYKKYRLIHSLKDKE